LLQHVSVYINHHQGAHNLCFTILISVIHVIHKNFGALAARYVQSCYMCVSCAVQNETHFHFILSFILHCLWYTRITGLSITCSHSTEILMNDIYNWNQYCNFGEAQTGDPWWYLCKPKHVGASVVILKVFNTSMILK
jgi:hypothetical protein